MLILITMWKKYFLGTLLAISLGKQKSQAMPSIGPDESYFRDDKGGFPGFYTLIFKKNGTPEVTGEEQDYIEVQQKINDDKKEVVIQDPKIFPNPKNTLSVIYEDQSAEEGKMLKQNKKFIPNEEEVVLTEEENIMINSIKKEMNKEYITSNPEILEYIGKTIRPHTIETNLSSVSRKINKHVRWLPYFQGNDSVPVRRERAHKLNTPIYPAFNGGSWDVICCIQKMIDPTSFWDRKTFFGVKTILKPVPNSFGYLRAGVETVVKDACEAFENSKRFLITEDFNTFKKYLLHIRNNLKTKSEFSTFVTKLQIDAFNGRIDSENNMPYFLESFAELKRRDPSLEEIAKIEYEEDIRKGTKLVVDQKKETKEKERAEKELDTQLRWGGEYRDAKFPNSRLVIEFVRSKTQVDKDTLPKTHYEYGYYHGSK